MSLFQIQQFVEYSKQTLRLTTPSAWVGKVPCIHPGAPVLHLPTGGHDVSILVPADPEKRYDPAKPLSHFGPVWLFTLRSLSDKVVYAEHAKMKQRALVIS